ncbi:hypothetical protein QYM36_009220 [Artemia franciscana]|uniref:Calponin-homology (CH) domain-containing protein n=1 Tax=Artemia franciscana TaxID=6661 RepID=A0AA88HL97_ARTSF|nr:hypothetical protein QYM36_009220 [Artemia franciscana]
MACIRGGKTGQGSADGLNQIGKKVGSPKSIIQIYTDWANHYLEKVKSKRRIQDLQTDIIDGVALADVIEAVTSHRLCDVNRKPKTTAQMTISTVNIRTTTSSTSITLKMTISTNITPTLTTSTMTATTDTISSAQLLLCYHDCFATSTRLDLTYPCISLFTLAYPCILIHNLDSRTTTSRTMTTSTIAISTVIALTMTAATVAKTNSKPNFATITITTPATTAT